MIFLIANCSCGVNPAISKVESLKLDRFECWNCGRIHLVKDCKEQLVVDEQPEETELELLELD